MLPSEKESLLIGQMIEGSHEAFEELYFIYVKAIRANISKIIREPGDIDDLAQEVFVALWQNKERLDSQKGGCRLAVHRKLQQIPEILKEKADPGDRLSC